MNDTPIDLHRRRLLSAFAGGAGLFAIGGDVLAGLNEASRGVAARSGKTQRAFFDALRGGLQAANTDGLCLPTGFSSRIVARSGERVAGTSYDWHDAPDGGACFATPDGGWVYACNAETPDTGGVGALRFDARGRIVDAYRILSGTRTNCSGGPTPWNTWLSCEEHDGGMVWECDPFKAGQGIARPAMGSFSHEACAVDPRGRSIYMTEDRGSDSGFYRYRPKRWPDLSAGVLEIAEIIGDPTGVGARVRWHRVPEPNPGAKDTPCRHQVAAAYHFQRGEGMVFHRGSAWFSTTADHRVWEYRCADGTIRIAYDADARFAAGREAPLRKPDNLAADAGGAIFVAEDGDDMQIVVLTPDGDALPLLQLVGHERSEIAGPALSPDGSRLYFSSQRGSKGARDGGITFEIAGPFSSRE
ncbi:MAG TPA: DUF839 domain-containing protein [Dokdonella sp.]|uniref:alkaline phosphatase PhoX n=1 Tax=Dokdonella sp. TaxID=2291710 RepID=UPI0025B99B26|nr:alkaline phosphatase PhoX [Dokdonella sp.]MBX3691644.1 DUF839 domain-containing protein [Dokdonella sp.]MCW5568273.1 DUF839 domain-containing protein [Dokdonella sp.]HNR91710.1 DUF839 domain-containing protein [Dokdonella sp.]